MSLASNLPYNNRILTDPNYVKAANLKSAVVTSGLDFVQVTPYPTTEQVILRADLSALTSTLDAGLTASVAWQDSADNSSFAVVPQLAGFTTNGTASLSAVNQLVLLPPTSRRYVRLAVTLTDSGSNATTNVTGSVTASVLF